MKINFGLLGLAVAQERYDTFTYYFNVSRVFKLPH